MDKNQIEYEKIIGAIKAAGPAPENPNELEEAIMARIKEMPRPVKKKALLPLWVGRVSAAAAIILGIIMVWPTDEKASPVPGIKLHGRQTVYSDYIKKYNGRENTEVIKSITEVRKKAREKKLNYIEVIISSSK